MSIGIERTARTLLLLTALASTVLAAGCGPSPAALAEVDYTPVTKDLWPVSTPQEQGLDPELVADLYYQAGQMENSYSVLLFRNGYLVAEDYFNEGSPEQQINIHSVTKSFTSALVGIALEQGCITSVDQPMMDFFPELADQVQDPRKNTITLRQMLQMRAGYPWEESTPELMELLFTGFRPATLLQVPLVRDPGTDFDYSNLTSHLIGIIVARACGTDLKTYAQQNLFDPLGIDPGFWQQDWEDYYLGFSDLHLTAIDLARFGLLVLNDGVHAGQQIVPADWVQESLQVYSEDAWKYRVGRNWKHSAYGYQWWSVQAGNYRYDMAWGHGGEQVVLVRELDMLIVVTVDPLHLQHGDGPWRLEKASLNLVADIVASLPRD